MGSEACARVDGSAGPPRGARSQRVAPAEVGSRAARSISILALAICSLGCDLESDDDAPPPPTPHAVAPSVATARFGVVVQRPDRRREVLDPADGTVISLTGPGGAALTWILPLPRGDQLLATTASGVLRGRVGESIAWEPAPISSGTTPPRVSASDASADTLVLDRAGAAEYGVVYELSRGASTVPLVEVAYPGGASVSADGAAIVVSGTPMPCPDLRRCPVLLWRVDEAGALARVPTREDRAAYKPQILDEDGQRWLVYQTTANDDSPECAGNLNRCRHDIVRRRFPDGPEELVARGAIAFAAGPVGRRAWLTPDSAECVDITCPTMRLHLIDRVVGDRVIDERAGSVMPLAFSPDGTWLAYRDRAADEIRVVHLGTLAIRGLGAGAPIGWIRLPGAR